MWYDAVKKNAAKHTPYFLYSFSVGAPEASVARISFHFVDLESLSVSEFRYSQKACEPRFFRKIVEVVICDRARNSSSHGHPTASEIHTPVYATAGGKWNVHATAAMTLVAAVLFFVVGVAESCKVVG